MDSFLDFILKDIETKKSIISTLPTKTKTNQKKLYETLEEFESKYIEYQNNIRNYLIAKKKSLKIKEDNNKIDELKSRINALEKVRFLLNPSNTYFEKMGFDLLLYQINNYYVFNFNSLNKIINAFLEKFESAGITLEKDDFDYTFYVHEYMSSYLDVYYKKSSNYNKVSEVFEQIYFINPDIIGHIELNFRKLIEKYKHKFETYIIKLQKEAMTLNNVKNYDALLEELKTIYSENPELRSESISDIIKLATKKEIDIEHYFIDSKVRKTAIESLLSIDIEDEKMDEVAKELEKLKENIIEYQNYLDFLPLIEAFKEEYKSLIEEPKKNSSGLQSIKETIIKKESELSKINRKIFGGKPSLFDFKIGDLKTLKIESIYKAKELYELYKIYDQEYFKDKVLKILDKTLSVTDILNLYNSYDYFKKLAIKKVFNIKSYDEIVEYSNKFDFFATKPNNVVMPGVLVFDDINIVRIIANKYRLNNIKITENDLEKNNLSNLMNKINLILRLHRIKKSNFTVDKIWFTTQVQKIIDNEKNS